MFPNDFHRWHLMVNLGTTRSYHHCFSEHQKVFCLLPLQSHAWISHVKVLTRNDGRKNCGNYHSASLEVRQCPCQHEADVSKLRFQDSETLDSQVQGSLIARGKQWENQSPLLVILLRTSILNDNDPPFEVTSFLRLKVSNARSTLL